MLFIGGLNDDWGELFDCFFCFNVFIELFSFGNNELIKERRGLFWGVLEFCCGVIEGVKGVEGVEGVEIIVGVMVV